MPIAKSVVQQIRENIETHAENYKGSFIPSEPHQKFFGMLDIPKTEFKDEDTIEKTKFIHEQTSGDKKRLRKILIRLGATPIGETRLDRVYKFLKLNQEAREALKYYNLTVEEAGQFKRKR